MGTYDYPLTAAPIRRPNSISLEQSQTYWEVSIVPLFLTADQIHFRVSPHRLPRQRRRATTTTDGFMPIHLLRPV